MTNHKHIDRLNGPFKIDVSRPMPICQKCQDEMFMVLNAIQELVNYEYRLYEIDHIENEELLNNMRSQLNTTINLIEKAYAHKCGKLETYLTSKYTNKNTSKYN